MPTYTQTQLKVAKFTVAFDDFQPNATDTGEIVIGQLPSGAVPLAYKFKHSVAFQGVGSTFTDASIFLADAGGNQFSNPNNCSVAPGDTVGIYGTNTTLNVLPDQNSASDVKANLFVDDGASGVTIDDLTGGSCDIWIWYTIGI